MILVFHVHTMNDALILHKIICIYNINPSTFLKDLVKHSLVALRIFEKDCLSTSWAVLSFPLDKGPGRKKTNINIRLQYDYLLTLIGAFTCKHLSLPTWKQCCQSTKNGWGSKVYIISIISYLAPLLLLLTFLKYFLLILNL